MKKVLTPLLLATTVVVATTTAQATTTTNTPSNQSHLPPYWHQTAPSWCNEDQICWIGSNADGRTAAHALKDFNHQMHIAQDDSQPVYVYAQDSQSDGRPIVTDRQTIHITSHTLHNDTSIYALCLATMQGLNTKVFVERVDFPKRCKPALKRS